MTATLKKTRDELVKKLTPKQRIELAEELIISAGGYASKEIEAAWEKEIDRRLDEYEAGRAETIPSEVVYAEARRKLNESKTRRVSQRRAA